MAKQYAGLKSVSYAASLGSSYTQIVGKISSDSSIEPDNTKVETTDGQVYGGSSISATIVFLDFTDYDTIEGLMRNDTAKVWKFIFKDGTTIITNEKIIPFVRKMPSTNSRDGLQMWELTFEKFDWKPLI